MRARRLLGVGAATLAVLLWPAAALAHPLGNFTVNVYDGLLLSPGRVRILHIVDMAEIPTFQELRRLEADGNPSGPELAAWAGRAARKAASALSVTVDDRPVTLRLEGATAELRPGQGGLPTLRLEATYVGAVPDTGTLRFRDGTFPGRIGWREVSAEGAAGTAVRRASVPATSTSDALRAYPEDLLSSPLRVSAATVSFGPGAAGAAGMELAPAAAHDGRREVSGGGFADLATGPLTPTAVAIALLFALGFGALHAMGPGHGKTIMAAYLVGSGERTRQVVAVALAVATMHTASVLALGMLVLSAERAFPAERLYPWLGLASGGLAIALGATLLATRLRRRTNRHRHDHPEVVSRPLSRRGLAVLAASGGLLPSPTAIVVLLASVALGRVAFGLALVGAFSIGLAAALAMVGILAMRARSHLAPRLGRWARLLPLGSASAITVAGALLVLRAAAQL